LALLGEGDLDPDQQAGDTIYEFTREVAKWPELLLEDQTLGVRSHIFGCSNLTNSELVDKRVRDAVCDSIRDARRPRPKPPPAKGFEDLPLQVNVFHDHIKIFRNLNGVSLHRRGYRRIMHKAALNEAAAAGILYLAGWDEIAEEKRHTSTGAVFVDPMCGSGTFLVEASMMARCVPPGSIRESWTFQNWPDYNKEEFLHVKFDADERTRKAKREWKGYFSGNDVNQTALRLANQCAMRGKQKDVIKFFNNPCGQWKPPQKPDLVVVNPPWGERLADSDENKLKRSWEELGDFLRKHCQGVTAYILSGNRYVTQDLGLRCSRKHPLVIGGIDCRLLRYEIDT